MKHETIQNALAAIQGVEWLDAATTSRIEIPSGEVRHLLLWHHGQEESSCEIILGEGAGLQLTELFTEKSSRRVQIHQAADSSARVTLLLLGEGMADFTIDLEGAHAESRLEGLFLEAAGELGEVSVRTNHLHADCQSYSLIKGVAGGEGAKGLFRGMVYVAPDAQRTDARQTSRNIELTPGARIQTLPQLEIYADDVKCSHGATVGQLDGEAILYMRQRGLDEKTARRLQIEGFAGDIVCHHPNEQLAEVLCRLVSEKLHTL